MWSFYWEVLLPTFQVVGCSLTNLHVQNTESTPHLFGHQYTPYLIPTIPHQKSDRYIPNQMTILPPPPNTHKNNPNHTPKPKYFEDTSFSFTNLYLLHLLLCLYTIDSLQFWVIKYGGMSWNWNLAQCSKVHCMLPPATFLKLKSLPIINKQLISNYIIILTIKQMLLNIWFERILGKTITYLAIKMKSTPIYIIPESNCITCNLFNSSSSS